MTGSGAVSLNPSYVATDTETTVYALHTSTYLCVGCPRRISAVSGHESACDPENLGTKIRTLYAME
jgi:hypothetical protein